MSAGPSRPLNEQLGRLWQSGTVSGLDDAELLRRTCGARSPVAEQAFEALIERHGPMVQAVCRSILKRPQDADDAFQATFLVLVRKSGSIRLKGSLAPWLYAVAHRTALRVRSRAARLLTGTSVEAADHSAEEIETDAWELGPLLHEELAGLPEKYRAPIVLCHLEGKSHEEAARLLNWPVGTLSGRLSRGRQVLKGRLVRRGIGSAAFLIEPTSTRLLPAVPSGLLASTLQAALYPVAAGSVPTFLHALSPGVISAMIQTRLSRLLLVFASLSTVGVALLLRPFWVPVILGSNPQSPQGISVVLPAPQPVPALQPGANGAVAGMGGMMGGTPTGIGMMAGMMSTQPFSPKNSPNLADVRDPIPIFRMNSILLVVTDDGKALAAMDTKAQEPASWQRYELPPGVTVTPIAGDSVVTFMPRGETVSEVAAFRSQRPGWVTQKLLNPVKEQIAPVVGPGSVLFQEGNNFYAFSAAAGKWDVLKLDGPEKPRASLNPTDITVQQGNRVYVFPLASARWTKGIEMRRFGEFHQAGGLAP